MSETLELAERLKIEGDKFVGIFSALTADQWRAEVYTEGALWTVRDVLAHFVTSERGLVKLFEAIRQGGAGATDDFSIDRYNAEQQEKSKDLPPAELIEQYKAVRGNSIHWVSGLQDSDLEIKGRHPFLGETVLREMIKLLYLHNQLHYRDVKKAIR